MIRILIRLEIHKLEVCVVRACWLINIGWFDWSFLVSISVKKSEDFKKIGKRRDAWAWYNMKTGA